MTRDLNL